MLVLLWGKYASDVFIIWKHKYAKYSFHFIVEDWEELERETYEGIYKTKKQMV